MAKYIGDETIIEANIDSSYFGIAFPIKQQISKPISLILRSLLKGSSIPYSKSPGSILSIPAIDTNPFISLFSDCGIIGCISSNNDSSLFDTNTIIKTIKDIQLTNEILDKAKNNAKVNYALKLESREGFIQDIIEQSYNGHYNNISNIFQSIDSISLQDIQKLLKEIFNNNPTMVIMGQNPERFFIDNLARL
jgi:hypothetical protein